MHTHIGTKEVGSRPDASAPASSEAKGGARGGGAEAEAVGGSHLALEKMPSKKAMDGIANPTVGGSFVEGAAMVEEAVDGGAPTEKVRILLYLLCICLPT